MYHGNLEEVKALLNGKSIEEIIDLLSRRDNRGYRENELVKQGEGCTSLHYAAGQGNLKIIEYIDSFFEDNPVAFQELLNIKNANGSTPIHWATREGHSEVVKFLGKKGVEISDSYGSDGKSLLSVAAFSGDFETFNTVIGIYSDRKMMNPNVWSEKDGSNRTVLFNAVESKNVDIARTCLEKEETCNTTSNRSYKTFNDPNGITPACQALKIKDQKTRESMLKLFFE